MLIVEDDPFNRLLIKSLLSKIVQINFFEASDGLEALDVMKQSQIDIILLDLHMPNMNGHEMLSIVKAERAYDEIAILIMTTDKEEKRKLYRKGADGFISKPFRLDELIAKIYKALLDKKERYSKKSVSNKKIANFLTYNYDNVEASQREFFCKLASLKALSNASEDLKIKLVATIAKEFALKLDYSTNQSLNIYCATKVRDVGLIGSSRILNYEDKFTDADRKLYGKYVLLGHQLLSNSLETGFIEVAKKIVLQYRESYDGSGIPYQIKGGSISQEAMIVMMAETFEALLGERAYRKQKCHTPQEAYDIFSALNGKRFDPVLVEIFLKNFSFFIQKREDIIIKNKKGVK